MADLQGLCTDNLNNDFEHQCFDEALWQLGARALAPTPGDIGDHMLEIPGIPNARFLPHQVWGVGFILKLFMNEDGLGLTSALIADDMGLGKTNTALGTVLHIKWLLRRAEANKPILFYGNARLSDLSFSCPFL